MNAPERSRLVSFAGKTYTVVDGQIELPEEAAHELLSHGFTMADATAAKPKKVKRGRPGNEEDAPAPKEQAQLIEGK
jgi:hypothetical protein